MSVETNCLRPWTATARPAVGNLAARLVSGLFLTPTTWKSGAQPDCTGSREEFASGPGFLAVERLEWPSAAQAETAGPLLPAENRGHFPILPLALPCGRINYGRGWIRRREEKRWIVIRVCVCIQTRDRQVISPGLFLEHGAADSPMIHYLPPRLSKPGSPHCQPLLAPAAGSGRLVSPDGFTGIFCVQRGGVALWACGLVTGRANNYTQYVER